MGELVFTGILFLFSVYLYSLTFGFSVSIMDKSGGAAFYPRAVMIFLMIFLVIRMIQILRKKEKDKFIFGEMFQGTRLFFLVLLAAYVALLKPAGYLISTTAFLLLLVNVLYRQVKGNWGKPSVILLRNILIVCFVFLMQTFFSRVLHVLLPKFGLL